MLISLSSKPTKADQDEDTGEGEDGGNGIRE